MKFKTTKKEILNSGGIVVKCGYCALQRLLINHEPDAHTVLEFTAGILMYIKCTD